ncbi:uncharacterized protein BO72DRAFT_450400 [Aspergillus fijiensis CBS 313.89]|uniref:Uncharacterized protein n=1 Tax=Aspergillus fijiensis CBS 313.89 TaxID=1448319 RepID=A0A8G1RMZ8_9EURO|nr:uncharacterized protein BO72DRAFT_450400 [Aspergillus fijiensis CBS 313.89]RAK74740.1 hypothetical protein BO72DRAFT_450400 [Aspergillus fijiensis CBS 313.89]
MVGPKPTIEVPRWMWIVVSHQNKIVKSLKKNYVRSYFLKQPNNGIIRIFRRAVRLNRTPLFPPPLSPPLCPRSSTAPALPSSSSSSSLVLVVAVVGGARSYVDLSAT